LKKQKVTFCKWKFICTTAWKKFVPAVQYY